MTKLTYITLDPNGSEPYRLIFLENECLVEGDDYHEKVSEYWRGITLFLDKTGGQFGHYEFEELDFDPRDKDKELWELGVECEDRKLNDYINKISKNFSLV